MWVVAFVRTRKFSRLVYLTQLNWSNTSNTFGGPGLKGGKQPLLPPVHSPILPMRMYDALQYTYIHRVRCRQVGRSGALCHLYKTCPSSPYSTVAESTIHYICPQDIQCNTQLALIYQWTMHLLTVLRYLGPCAWACACMYMDMYMYIYM